MKNPKEIEKKSEKEIDKKREKEIFKEKIEKPETKEVKETKDVKETKEFKEKPEKQEIKEIKEKPERKEFKEAIKEKVEVKEIKEFDKQIPEKGGKELVEGGDPGEIFQRRSADANLSTESLNKPKEDELAKQKEIDKIKPEKEQFEKVQKDIEKIKPEKEVREKIQKEIEKIKPEKENFEKVQKDIEKIKPEKEFAKHEIEKFHQKDFLPDKYVFENDPKGIVENPGTGPIREPIDRKTLFTASTPDDRLTQLEEAVTKLSHFIGADLRPDLSEGALRGEADTTDESKGEAKPEEKTRKPK
jgi:hypothetical protein